MNHISREFLIKNIVRSRKAILELARRNIRYSLTPKGEPIDLLEKLYMRFYELTKHLPPYEVEEIIKNYENIIY